jgi:hypothetical protein
MPWTPRQKRYLLSSGSPLSGSQKDKMLHELHENPALGHAKKGSKAMKGSEREPESEGKSREGKEALSSPISGLRIQMMKNGKGKVTGHIIHHEHPPKSTKSGAFMSHEEESYPFGPKGEAMDGGMSGMEHIAHHLGWGKPMERGEPEDEMEEEEQEA